MLLGVSSEIDPRTTLKELTSAMEGRYVSNGSTNSLRIERLSGFSNLIPIIAPLMGNAEEEILRIYNYSCLAKVGYNFEEETL